MTPESIGSFAFLTAGGILLALAVTRIEQVSWRYLRLIAILSTVLLAATLAAAFRWPGSIPLWPRILGGASGTISAALLFAAPRISTAPLPWRWLCAAGGLCGVAAASSLFAAAQPASVGTPSRLIVLALAHLSAAGLLGTVTATWLLGHAYLTATTMTIAPLRRLSRLFMGAVIVRAITAGLGVGGLWMSGGLGANPFLLTDWIAWTFRVLVGLLAVGVFAYLVLGTLKWRNTQSATGILYFASVFVYMGELAGYYLTGITGWPI